jgi:hypothetical protein
VTISKVSPNICEKTYQKFVTISVALRSAVLSFCQICMTITIDVLIVTNIWPSVINIWQLLSQIFGRANIKRLVRFVRRISVFLIKSEGIDREIHPNGSTRVIAKWVD